MLVFRNLYELISHYSERRLLEEVRYRGHVPYIKRGYYMLHVAVIYQKIGKQYHVYAAGTNTPEKHAETAAIAAYKRLPHHTRPSGKQSIHLLVFRTDRNMHIQNSRPCRTCTNTLASLKKNRLSISHVVYSIGATTHEEEQNRNKKRNKNEAHFAVSRVSDFITDYTNMYMTQAQVSSKK